MNIGQVIKIGGVDLNGKKSAFLVGKTLNNVEISGDWLGAQYYAIDDFFTNHVEKLPWLSPWLAHPILDNELSITNSELIDYSKFSQKFEAIEDLYQEQIPRIYLKELHKLKNIVESHGGIVLDVNTDAVNCVFPDNVFPFKLVRDIQLDNHYWDKDNKYKNINLNMERIECRFKNFKSH